MTLIFCLKHTLTLEDDVDVCLRNLFRVDTFQVHSTRPPIFLSQRPTFLCVEISNIYVLS